MRLPTPRARASALVLAVFIAAGPTILHAQDRSAEARAVEAVLDDLAAARKERDELARERDAAEGERREVLEERIWQSRLASHERLRDLAEGLEALVESGQDPTAIRQRMVAAIRQGWPATRDELLAYEDRLEDARARLDAAPAEDQATIEEEIRTLEDRVADGYRLLTDSLTLLDPTGVDVSAERAFVVEKLTEWADLLAARSQLLLRRRDDVATRAADDADDTVLAEALHAAEGRLDRTVDSLGRAADLLDRLGVDTASYRQALIGATGEITTDILDTDVALGLLGRMRDRLFETIASGAPGWLFKALLFLAILVAFRAIARLVRSLVAQSVRSSNLHLSQLLQDTLVAWSSRLVLLAGALVALSQLGVEIGALLAGLGIAGFVIGFALQDSLANFAAGAMILVYRPFDVGDIVEAAGVSGTVSRMTLVSTTILTFDNQTLIVPNNKIWGDVIRNVTAQKIRRVDLVFGIGYGDDIEKADAAIRGILDEHEQVLDEPKPIVEVHELGDSSVNFVVRPWCKTEDYWPVHWSVTRRIKQAFDREGITIPFPQRDVHHYWDGGAPPERPASGGGEAATGPRDRPRPSKSDA